MGRASRWLKSLFSGTTSRKKDPTQNPPPENKSWSFSGRKGSSYRENPGSCQPKHVVGDGDESKRAIAVAVATAAVAEAAVAAAEASAAVVRLTSRWRSWGGRIARRTVIWAAVKIQSAFRGYLARRALKALRGFVKIQALVRGHIVRKQAAETLRCMQSLVRAQARVRAGRLPAEAQLLNKTSSRRHPHEPSKQEKEHCVRIDDARAERSKSLKKNFSRAKNNCSVEEKLLLPPGSNWLDQWMSECYCNGHDDGKTEKILEVDGAKPHSNPKINSKLRNRHRSMCSTTTLNQNDFILAAMPASPSKDSTTVQHSMMSSSSAEVQQHSSSPLGFPYEADSFYSACSRFGVPRSRPFTPSKSECSQSFLSDNSDCPNYMLYTESSRSKVRSHSAPRQRPEHEKFGSLKKSALQGCGAGGHPFSSSQRSFSLQLKFAGKAYPGSGRLDRLGVRSKYN